MDFSPVTGWSMKPRGHLCRFWLSLLFTRICMRLTSLQTVRLAARLLFCSVHHTMMTRLSRKEWLLKHTAVIRPRAKMDVMKSAPTNTRFIFFRCTSWTQKMTWKCYYYPINSYQAGGQPCEQTVNHLARINMYNGHAVGLTYQSGITHFHLQGTRYL
jgi:hypothetical protein